VGMQALPELGPCSASSGPLCGSSAWPLGLVKRIAFGLGHVHGLWAWSCAWHLGLVMCMAFGLGQAHGLWAWSRAWPLGFTLQ
jgi:hypothetical protein